MRRERDPDRLWLDAIAPVSRPGAVKAIEAGDVVGFLIAASPECSLTLVYRNFQYLLHRGLYEEALLKAFVATRANNHGWSVKDLKFLFYLADKERLRRAGDQLPGPGPFVIYRGVAGRGRARRVRGYSWTASKHQAWWFASRFSTFMPDRFPDPAVFCVTVEASDVLTYSNERYEEEFLVSLPPVARPKRVAESSTSPTISPVIFS